MQIWPAIDLRGGLCVRLKQGDYGRETVYGSDPAQMAAEWVAAGAERLHLVDLDGARDGRRVNRDAVADIAASVSVPCQLGGGIRSVEAVDELITLGLSRLVVGTRAIQDPDWFRELIRRYPGTIALGIDARDGRVATDGWLSTSDTLATELARMFADEPLAAIVYTDISRDGMLEGPNVDAVADMVSHVGVPIVASGGVTTADDVSRLARSGAAGCIIGRSLYEGTLILSDAIAAAG